MERPKIEGRQDWRCFDLELVRLRQRGGAERGVGGRRRRLLVKPFSARELLARIDAHLARRTLRRLERQHARQLATVFENAPVAIAVLRGPELVFESALRPGALKSLMHRLPFSHAAKAELEAEQHARAKTAADVMVTDVATARRDQLLRDAIAPMMKAAAEAGRRGRRRWPTSSADFSRSDLEKSPAKRRHASVCVPLRHRRL